MAKCSICNEFFPPGYTVPIPNTKYYKCKFCDQGKDKILEVDKMNGDLIWDVKIEIINKYRFYINEIVRDREKRKGLYRGINETY